MKLQYKIDDKLPIGQMFIYAMQWFILSVAVISTSVFVAQGSPAERLFFAQKLFAVIGITGVIQVLFGHKMPLVVGPASVLLVGVLSSLSAGAPVGAIYTSIAIGGALILLLSFGGMMSKVRKLFTPRIVVVILMLIAFTLAPVIKNLIFPERAEAEQHLFGLIFALVGCVGMVLLNRTLKGVAKSLVVPIALIVGSAAYYLLFPLQQGAVVEGVFRGQFFNDFSFDWSLLVAFVICYIALLINDIGSIESLGVMLNAEDMGGRLKRGVRITGAIASTGCASRWALLPATLLLVLCSLFPDVIFILTSIPNQVIGVILLFLMGTQLSAGLEMAYSTKAISSFSGALTISLPIMVALLFQLMPRGIVPSVIEPLVGNGFAMGVITVLVMEHLINRTKE